MKVDLLQARCAHCDRVYILGLEDPPWNCPGDSAQIITTIAVDLEDNLATQCIEAGIGFVHETQDNLGN